MSCEKWEEFFLTSWITKKQDKQTKKTGDHCKEHRSKIWIVRVAFSLAVKTPARWPRYVGPGLLCGRARRICCWLWPGPVCCSHLQMAGTMAQQLKLLSSVPASLYGCQCESWLFLYRSSSLLIHLGKQCSMALNPQGRSEWSPGSWLWISLAIWGSESLNGRAFLSFPLLNSIYLSLLFLTLPYN